MLPAQSWTADLIPPSNPYLGALDFVQQGGLGVVGLLSKSEKNKAHGFNTTPY